MSGICWAWDWNIPPDNAMQMDSPEPMQIGKEDSEKDNRPAAKLQTEEDHPQTPKQRISPDIFNDSMQLTIPTVSLNKGKAAANQSNQSEYLQKKQEKNSITNITII